MNTDKLKPSCDSKTRFYKTQKNTFGLLPGGNGTCPGATTGEGGCWNAPGGRKNKTCYVDNLMKIYSGVRGVLEHNTQLLKAADKQGKIALLNAEFERFRKAETRRDTPCLHYRIHWSGDIFDAEYAEALAEAMTVNSDIQFWCYTRSFFAVPTLCTVPNLSLYLSLDPVNYAEGMLEYVDNKPNSANLAICYMAATNDITIHEDEVKAMLAAEGLDSPASLELATQPGYGVCPADAKRIKKEEACKTCGKCTLPNPGNVWFKT